MARFSKIKKYNLKSLSIDEKIKFLDKEMEKTGLNEEPANSTSGVYRGSETNSNQQYAEFTAKNFNGYGFGFSGDPNLGQGNLGGASIRASDGAALSPPHPVTGAIRTTQTKGSLGTKLARPGDRPTPSARMTGPILWYYDPSASFGQGAWLSLEYNSAAVHGNSPYPFGPPNAGWGYWGSDFLGFPLLRSDGEAFASLFAALNDSNGDQFNPDTLSNPETVVLTQNRLDDSSFLPIDVAKRFIAGVLDLAGEGLDFLRDRAYNSDLIDSALDLIASVLDADGAKNNVDDYMRKFIPDLLSGKNPPGSDKDNPRDASGNFDAKTISDYEEIYKDYRKEKNGEKSSLDTSWEVKYSLKARDNTDIGGSTGTLDPSAGDGFIDNGDGTETLRKAFDFDRFDDLIGSDVKTGLGAMIYGVFAGVPNVLGKGEGGKTPTMYMGITFDKKTGKVIPNYKPKNVKESLDESVKLGHFDPEALTVDIEDIRKGIMPEFPKKPPVEMIDGYSVKSKLAPKVIKGEPTIKVRKKDLAALHILKDSEIKELLQQIDLINAHLQNNPADLIYAQQRYPKNDIRLAKLNWKMDQMMNAGKEYLDTQFPENQRLVDRVKKATKKTMELTNPEAYKNLNKPDMELMSLDDHMKEKRVVSRHFKKKRQSKSMFRVDMEKVKEKNRKVAEQKVAEWQEKRRIELLNSNEFEDKKYDWRKEIGENFVNSTQGMKVGQTFTHVPSGETVTTSGVLGGIETLQTNVSILGDEIPGPNATQYGLQGFAKPIDIMRRGKKKTEDLNKELDSSEKYTKEIKADEYMKARVDIEAEQEKKAAKIIYNIIKKLPRTRFNQELKVLYGYLSGEMTEKITNEFISKKHLISLFKTASMRPDGGRVQMDDFIVGSGQKLTYDPNTDRYSVKFNYDFETNAQEILNTKLPYLKRVFLPYIGGKYGYDAGIFGRMVERAKELGFGQNIEGEFTISGEDLNKINPNLIYLYNTHPDYQNDMGGFDTGHGYSAPPSWLDKWARRVEFTGDLRSLWNGKTRTWNLRGKIVDNNGRPIKKLSSKQSDRTGYGYDTKGGLDSSGYGMDPSRDTETKARPFKPSKAVKKVKSMSKTKRQSLSLDKPFVRTKGKKKEEG